MVAGNRWTEMETVPRKCRTVVFLWFLLFQECTSNDCNKFATNENKLMGVSFNNVCYYTFSGQVGRSDARGICEGEGARLPFMDSEIKQQMLAGMIGFQAPEYWLGLEYKGGRWVWKDQTDEYPMAEPRWSSDQTLDNIPAGSIYSTGSGTTWKQQTVEYTTGYICEDSTAPPAIIAKDTNVHTCVSLVGMNSVHLKRTSKTTSLIECARHCTKNDNCVCIKYDNSTSSCQEYKPGPFGFTFVCGTSECFHCT